MNAPTPSSPDPARPGRSHRNDGGGARSRPAGQQPAHPHGTPGGPYGAEAPYGSYGGQGSYGFRDSYGGNDPYGGGQYGGDPHGGGQYGGDPYGSDSHGGNDSRGGDPYGGPSEHGAHVPSYPEEAEAGGPGARREAFDGLLCALVVTVLGVGLGLMWLWLAPRVPLVTVDGAVFLKDPEGEEAIGADGTFVLLAVGFGVVTGALAFLRSRGGGVGLVVGLAVGALLGSVLAWRLGVWLGPDTDLVAAAKAAGAGKTFDGPLKLQAKSALLVWPLLALIVHLTLTGLFGKRDPEPEDPHYPPPGADGSAHSW
ncbi:hypothetical protein ACFPA8_25290 [Streptomyces ovatisporus]|uniref:ABC transporter permease n=1 Tax=Streptomyces ovatisporus TaxID=1128682 RepID=A0ABV9AF00_9ACTN